MAFMLSRKKDRIKRAVERALVKSRASGSDRIDVPFFTFSSSGEEGIKSCFTSNMLLSNPSAESEMAVSSWWSRLDPAERERHAT